MSALAAEMKLLMNWMRGAGDRLTKELSKYKDD
jgi:hypothetical protein